MGDPTALLHLSVLAEASKGHGIAEFVVPLWIWTYLIFGGVLFVLWKWAFGPLRDAMAAREDRIRDTVEKAKRIKEEAEQLLTHHQQMMESARADAQKVIDKGRETAEHVRAEALEDAQREAREIIERAQSEIGLEAKKAVERIRAEAVDLSLMAASRILERSVTDEDHQRLVGSVIDELAGEAG